MGHQTLLSTLETVSCGIVVGFIFLMWMKRLVGRPFVNVPAALKQCIAHLRPEVEKRREKTAVNGKDYEGKPVGEKWVPSNLY